MKKKKINMEENMIFFFNLKKKLEKKMGKKLKKI
jgi:hypothetical protein